SREREGGSARSPPERGLPVANEQADKSPDRTVSFEGHRGFSLGLENQEEQRRSQERGKAPVLQELFPDFGNWPRGVVPLWHKQHLSVGADATIHSLHKNR